MFRFYNQDGKVHWEAPLVEKRCKSILHNGDRCRNMTALVHPYCIECLPRKFNVSIRDSNLGPKVGKGLFVTDYSKKLGDVVFEKGDYICPYLGEFVSKNELQRRYCESSTRPEVTTITTPYAFNTGKYDIDGALYRGPAVYANDAKGSGYRNNSSLEFDEDSKKLKLYATRKIRNGEEILTSYGSGYWRGFHLPFETKRM